MVKAKSDKIKKNYTDEELGVLKNVNRRLSLLVDYKHQLASGIFRGIGFAIGASIIGAIIVYLLLSFFREIPVVKDFVDRFETSTDGSQTQNE